MYHTSVTNSGSNSSVDNLSKFCSRLRSDNGITKNKFKDI
ncbi:8927_t:CDS:2 [Funneliformis mosseae]|uniref:8927_t:CDS:1 n=1 Tax=Funneliformis mosseae TaxID=27381 RepID=A0A9N9AJ44_FUNMO|nr:8927_t:CDS:2 [Funneliformis mosseae]